jgi:hypothetical protein
MASRASASTRPKPTLQIFRWWTCWAASRYQLGYLPKVLTAIGLSRPGTKSIRRNRQRQSVRRRCAGRVGSHAPREATMAADRNCAVAPSNKGIPRQKRRKYSVPATNPSTPTKASTRPSNRPVLSTAAWPTTRPTPVRPNADPSHWVFSNRSRRSAKPNTAVSSGVRDCTIAIWAAGAVSSPTCGAIKPTAFSRAPAIAQCSHFHPASGCQDRRSRSIAATSRTAQPASRIATNSNGERCCNPVFVVMKDELQSRINNNRANLTTSSPCLVRHFEARVVI